MAVIIPQDYQGKTVEEMYNDLETIAKAYMKQKKTVEDLQGEIKIRDKVKGEKIEVEEQKLELEKVKLQSDDIIDMNHFEIIEEDGKLKRIYNS